MRTLYIAPILILLVSSSAMSRSHNVNQASVPFVGCRSDGQLGPRPAPKRHLTPHLLPKIAQKLAFYAAADGQGVLAPRGWKCFGFYGSNGQGLIVTSQSVDFRKFFSANGFTTKLNAVELSYNYGGTSGRWAVAHAITRYLPAYRKFIQTNFDGLEVGPLPKGPYPHDVLVRHSANAVRYVTPPFTAGEGTSWMLSPSSRPIQGFATLLGDVKEPNLSKVNVRLPEAYEDLADVIIDNARREAN